MQGRLVSAISMEELETESEIMELQVLISRPTENISSFHIGIMYASFGGMELCAAAFAQVFKWLAPISAARTEL
jgi:hypothetical protein